MIGQRPRKIPSTQQHRARELRSNATLAERKLWQALRASQLDGFKFSRQIAIGPFIADLVCRKQRLVIEIDGSQHGDAADISRQRFIEAQGYRILRFWNAQIINDIDIEVAIIRNALPAETAHPRPLPQAGGERLE